MKKTISIIMAVLVMAIMAVPGFAASAVRLTYNLNGVAGTAPIDYTDYNGSSEQATILNAPDVSGYIFKNWNTKADGLGKEYLPGEKMTVSADTTLYAQWTDSVTVTYVNTITGSTNKVSSKISGTHVVLSNMFTAPAGYTFKEWNLEEDGKGEKLEVGTRIQSKNDVTIYAIWEPVKYTITYDANCTSYAGIIPTDSKSYTYGEEAKTAAFGLINNSNNGTQVAWNTLADGKGSSYGAKETFTVRGNTTLYAIYDANCTVKYSFNGADIDEKSIASSTVKAGTEITLPTIPAKDNSGTDLLGWCLKKDGSDKIYPCAATYTVTDNVTFYAIYGNNSLTVDYDMNGIETENGAPKDSTTYEYGATVTIKAADEKSKDGKVFKEWNTKADGTGTSYKANEKVVINENIKLYAIYESKEYTVTYDLNGAEGTAPETKSYASGTKLKLAEYTGKSSKTFVAWNSQKDGKGTAVAPGTEIIITGDVTFYASFKEDGAVEPSKDIASVDDIIPSTGSSVKIAVVAGVALLAAVVVIILIFKKDKKETENTNKNN